MRCMVIQAIAALLLATSACAQQSLSTEFLYISHLSPLLEYSPSSFVDNTNDGWSLSLSRSSTNSSEASVRWSYFGLSFEVFGNASNVEVVQNLTDTDGGQAGVNLPQGASRQSTMLESSFFVEQDWYTVDLMTNSSEGSYIDLREVSFRSSLPSDGGFSRGTHIPANTDVSWFFDDDDAWNNIEPPTNDSTEVPFISRNISDDIGNLPFNSTVLSTNQTGNPLRIVPPPYTSLMHCTGTVGPRQGRYEVRIVPSEANGEVQFQPYPLNQSFSGDRPIDASFETKIIAWLDPRARYEVFVELLEEGKSTDLHGCSFYDFTGLGAQIEDWYEPQDNKSGGLSGGQIAGIVVGSIAGAVLIGLAAWLLVRRRRRVSSTHAGMKESSNDVEDRSL